MFTKSTDLVVRIVFYGSNEGVVCTSYLKYSELLTLCSAVLPPDDYLLTLCMFVEHDWSFFCSSLALLEDLPWLGLQSYFQVFISFAIIYNGICRSKISQIFGYAYFDSFVAQVNHFKYFL